MFEQINSDLKDALKQGDKFRLSVLRMLKSALQLEKTKPGTDLTDEIVISVLKQQLKQRQDSLKEYEKLNKQETVADLEEEIKIIQGYLPKEASLEEITKTIEEAFNDINPTSMKDMGLIMKYVSSHLSNADMTKVSAIVKERLSKQSFFSGIKI